jgi:hypothetical protein
MTRITDHPSLSAALPATLLTMLLSMFMAMPARGADAPVDVVAKAIQKEGATKVNAIHLTYTHGATTDDYTLEEILPDRLHMIRTTAGHTLELIAVSPTIYTRWDGSAWTSSPMAKAAADMSVITGVLLHGMTHVKELPITTKAGKKQRNFSGNMAWTNHGSEHRGKVSISIASVSRLPLSLAFTGTCNGAPCSFQQTFSYDASIKIDAPTP